MSFLRHGEIYHFDEGAIPQDHALAHRNDEFPAGYSLAGCAPAEPAAASPAGAHLARKGFRSTMQFQRTVRSALTVCLTQGDNLNLSLAADIRLCQFQSDRFRPRLRQKFTKVRKIAWRLGLRSAAVPAAPTPGRQDAGATLALSRSFANLSRPKWNLAAHDETEP
jgi:hypothetical protein